MSKTRSGAVLLAALMALAGCAQTGKEAPTAKSTSPISANAKIGQQQMAFLPDPKLRGRSDYGRIDLPQDQLDCLAQAIYFEAGTEPMVGQRAVGAVVLNRLRDERFPKSVCGVVQEGGGGPLGTCQFSWYCDGKSDEVADDSRWSSAQQAAADVLSNGFDDPTDGALFFHNKTVRPAWSRRLKKTASIGGHIFYR